MRILLFFAVFYAVAAHAQQKPVYTASLEAGIVKGNSDNSHSFFLTSGIQYKNVAVSIGAGVDDYLFRSVPLFVDVRKNFGYHRIQPFVDASAGININAVKNNQKGQYNYYYSNAHFKNGFFGKVSTGASLKIYGNLRFFVDIGFTYKTTRIVYDSYLYYPQPSTTTSTDITGKTDGALLPVFSCNFFCM